MLQLNILRNDFYKNDHPLSISLNFRKKINLMKIKIEKKLNGKSF